MRAVLSLVCVLLLAGPWGSVARGDLSGETLFVEISFTDGDPGTGVFFGEVTVGPGFEVNQVISEAFGLQNRLEIDFLASGEMLVRLYTDAGGSLAEGYELRVSGFSREVTGFLLIQNDYAVTRLESTGLDSFVMEIPDGAFLTNGNNDALVLIELGDVIPPPPVLTDMLGDTIEASYMLPDAIPGRNYLNGGTGYAETVVVDPGVEFPVAPELSIDFDATSATILFTVPGDGFISSQILDVRGVDAAVLRGFVESSDFVGASVAHDSGGFVLTVPLQHVAAGVYALVVRVVFEPEVFIEEHPATVFVEAGGTITLSALASATLGTPEYRWLKNGTPIVNGGRVSGADSPMLTIVGAVNSDTERYSVRATVPDGVGPAESETAIVSVPASGVVSADLDLDGDVDVFDLIAFLQAFSAALN